MRQEKWDRDREQRRRQHERPVGAIVPVQPEPDGQQHDHECGCADAELCGDLGVARLRKERKDGRGVIVEPGADAARLLKRDGQRIPQSASGDDGRQHHDHARGGEGQRVPQLDAPREPEEQEHRHDEHGLQFEGERCADAHHAEHGMPGQHEIDAQHGEGGIHTVALAPERAVEHDRRPEEHEEERRKLPHRLTPEQSHELHDRRREHDVKKDAEQFYKVQIRQGTAADERQKRQVRYIIIANGLPQCGEPAVRAEKVDPHGQKLRVVARLIIQAQPTQHERRRQQQHRAQDVRRFAQHTRAPQQHQREPGLGSQQQTDSDIHGHPSEDTKKRQGDALLPAKNSQIRA